ncbi:MAG: ABC transporter permease [Lewinellaceae bacterium]|nr:ABC transporter permease [Saprospiraceae bacterium]MCB9268970.1 ABC transporter permease [Lewinellaceae bacterium]HPG08012.1 ABC transporter permease [Saprospiraceae bacterium]HPR01541.1 ABC transporter permease [Saprospiraceae bacterium]
MKAMTQIWSLIRKDWMIEWRLKYALSGLLLYLITLVFVIVISFQQISGPVWNVLYWILFLFVGMNAVLKSYQQESGQRKYYFQQLIDPVTLLISKTLYNIVLLFLAALLIYLLLSVFIESPVQHYALFLGTVAAVSVSFGICLTFISIVANQAAESATLAVIIGFPVLLPVLITGVRMSAFTIGMSMGGEIEGDFTILFAIDLLLLGLSLWLFPFLWKD